MQAGVQCPFPLPLEGACYHLSAGSAAFSFEVVWSPERFQVYRGVAAGQAAGAGGR